MQKATKGPSNSCGVTVRSDGAASRVGRLERWRPPFICHFVISTMEVLMTMDEIAIPVMSGNAKHKTWRSFAGPADRDAAMNGKMNAARIAIAQIAALIPTSLFFSDGVITAILLLVEGVLLCSSADYVTIQPAAFRRLTIRTNPIRRSAAVEAYAVYPMLAMKSATAGVVHSTEGPGQGLGGKTRPAAGPSTTERYSSTYCLVFA